MQHQVHPGMPQVSSARTGDLREGIPPQNTERPDRAYEADCARSVQRSLTTRVSCAVENTSAGGNARPVVLASGYVATVRLPHPGPLKRVLALQCLPLRHATIVT